MLAGIIVIIVLVILCSRRPRLNAVLWAKALTLLMNTTLIVAIVLLPFGLPFLDDPCGSDEKQCGLQCGNDDGQMSYFVLCSPYEVGTSVYLFFAGEVLIFIACFFAACVGIYYGVFGDGSLEQKSGSA